MADNFDEVIEVLKFAFQMIGKTDQITINSGVYEHLHADQLEDIGEANTDGDFYVIGPKENGIVLEDIIEVFREMNLQIKKVYNCDRSYFFEGIYYDMRMRMWRIMWGS